MRRLAALPLAVAASLAWGCTPSAGELPPTRTPLTLPTLAPSPTTAPTASTSASPVVAVEVQPTFVGEPATPTSTADPAFFSPSPEGVLSDLVPIVPEVAAPGGGPPQSPPPAAPPVSELTPLEPVDDVADNPPDGAPGGVVAPAVVLPGFIPSTPAVSEPAEALTPLGGAAEPLVPEPASATPASDAPPSPIVPEPAPATATPDPLIPYPATR